MGLSLEVFKYWDTTDGRPRQVLAECDSGVVYAVCDSRFPDASLATAYMYSPQTKSEKGYKQFQAQVADLHLYEEYGEKSIKSRIRHAKKGVTYDVFEVGSKSEGSGVFRLYCYPLSDQTLVLFKGLYKKPNTHYGKTQFNEDMNNLILEIEEQYLHRIFEGIKANDFELRSEAGLFLPGNAVHEGKIQLVRK